ncbi:MAG TPA: thiamine phosphate synthase [Arenibaculum sp.]|nr:thiamine phosphate synthase [Arenibaculum sp.]
MPSLPVPPLLVVTDRRQAVRPLAEIAAEVVAGGCRWISLREKDLAPAEQVAAARRLAGIAAPAGALVTLHGDPALAVAAGLRGVHLPAGGDPAAARRLLGPAALIGCSVHSPAEAGTAAAAGADYVILGPVFPTASKPGYGPALGLEGLAAVARRLPVPVVAIGGIGPDDVRPCIGAGAAGIAVMGPLMRSPHPAADAEHLLRGLRGSAKRRPDPG